MGYLTFSIDDGHPTDFRSAELLAKYGLKSTFYIPAANPEREVLSPERVRELATQVEIGAHTMSHLSLDRMPDDKAWIEIRDSKKWVEDLTGKVCTPFCYPQGKFTRKTEALVEKAGFIGARNCFFNVNTTPASRYSWGVSTHAYSHSPLVQLRHAIVEGNWRGLAAYLPVHHMARDWATHFQYAVEWASQNNGTAHLFWHSWEIDQNGEWGKLEGALRTAQASPLLRVTNGELFRTWRKFATI